MMVGSVMKAGFEALEKLGIDAGAVVSDKIRTNNIKYSPQRLQRKGSAERAKQDWNRKQLPVIQPDVIYEAA